MIVRSVNSAHAESTHTLPMTIPKKKKKSSTSIRIVHPQAYTSHAHAVRFHRNNNRTTTSTAHVVVSAGSGSHGTPLSKYPESDELFSEYIADLVDIQHDDPAEANTKGKEKSQQGKHSKLMDEWLTYREDYLQEMLRHDRRGGLDVTYCADCGERGDFSCHDCAYSLHYCQECLVDRHCLMPLHRIRVCRLILSVI